MYCVKCASPIDRGARFCAECGAPVGAMPVGISRHDARMMAQENQKAKAGGTLGTILLAAVIQAFWLDASMVLAFGIAALAAFVPAVLTTSVLSR
jgi:ribosomal protein S14